MWSRSPSKIVTVWLVAVASATSPALATEGQASRLVPLPEVRDRQGQLTVVNERIVVRCREQAPYVLACGSESTLTVRNEVGQPVELTLEADLGARKLEVDGTPVVLDANLDRMLRLGKATIPAGNHEIRLVIPSALTLNLSPDQDLFDRVLSSRHPLAADHPGKPFSAEITIQSAKKYRRWARVEHTRVLLQVPARWQWRASAESTTAPPPCPASGGPPNGLEGCIRDGPAGHREAEWSFASSDQSHFARSVAVTPPSPVVFDGGPLVGAALLGRTDQWDWAEAARVWVGYELGITDLLLLGMAAEVSGGERLTAIPSLDFALMMQAGAIPAVTAGVGLPGRLVPEPELGVRLQLGVGWALGSAVSLAVVVPLEWFPGNESGAYPHAGGGVVLGL